MLQFLCFRLIYSSFRLIPGEKSSNNKEDRVLCCSEKGRKDRQYEKLLSIWFSPNYKISLHPGDNVFFDASIVSRC